MSQNDFLDLLNVRSQEIFRRLVERYLDTGEPVGSRQLSRMLDVSLSPASVRNVMADLEELGLIRAPHVSAGRAPTQSGLRFFVDAMLEVGRMDDAERQRIEEQISSSASSGTPDEFLTEASQMLSGLSRGAGVVISAKTDLRLKHLEFVRLDADTGMAVLVGENGTVENRIVPLPLGMESGALSRASNYLNHHIVGKTLTEARKTLADARADAARELDEISNRLVEAGIASLNQPLGDETPTVIVRGRANLIDSAMASEDLERLRELLDELERKKGLIELLSEAEQGEGVRIFIGSENKLFSLSGSSVILSPYKDANDKVVGALGVIGPTRLNYARIVPVVDYTAHVVGRLVTRKT
ncbi:MAG: heat-inducible transcriptional repressor HrcA [Hyphomicrobiaceae bacterium]|nr:heat-inducible transcriptional repressor HrcA [Hyphomicrobiaceae bacterium]MCC0024044.1 heat-inducible transcriptional repressor HrcA [Hyphomicrobiaceae bacterium]